jgi:opacity protein-like surface antigen
MRKTIASALVGLSALALPFGAQAQGMSTPPSTPWYGQLNAGMMFLQDANGRFGGIPGEAEYDTGYSLSGALGYRFLGGWRAEAEFGYGRTSYDKIRGAGETSGVSGGDVNIYSFTGNAYYDFPTGTLVTPYLGGGVGLVRTTYDNGTANFGFGNVSTRRSDRTSFTALAEAGASVAITPGMDLVPSYRFQWINDGDDGYDNTRAHMLRLGLRVNF